MITMRKSVVAVLLAIGVLLGSGTPALAAHPLSSRELYTKVCRPSNEPHLLGVNHVSTWSNGKHWTRDLATGRYVVRRKWLPDITWKLSRITFSGNTEWTAGHYHSWWPRRGGHWVHYYWVGYELNQAGYGADCLNYVR